jgi:signal transduction histidine kinase
MLIMVLTLWGADRDLQFIRAALLQAEVDQVRSYAERTVERIEWDLEERAASSLEELGTDGWLQRHWNSVIPSEKRQFYAAVVRSSDNTVIYHSDSSRMGQRLPNNWYHRALIEVGDDVVETRNSALASDKLAYDVQVPIYLDGRGIGVYHAGFDVAWFEEWSSRTQAVFVRRRTIVIACVLLTVLLATTSLYYVATHSIALRRAVESASLDRATEVGKLAAGLAHEIRNPLHAIQLNLHTFRRSQEQKIELPTDELVQMLEQSTNEINRIEQLMQQLVGFSTPEEPRKDVMDVKSGIRAVVDFIQLEMLDRKIEIVTHLPPGPVHARMDPGRLRQIMLNLLQNSQQAMDQSGKIDVGLAQRRGYVEITVADNGPGVPESDRARIFEPFFSTRTGGTGLGLALVKRFVEEVGGEIYCEPNPGNGVTFRIRMRGARMAQGA